MPAPEFLNENRHRAFPFQTGTTGVRGATPGTIETLPNWVVVDAGFIVGLDANFVDGTNSVYLAQIRRSGATIYFDFASDAPGLYGQLLTFTRNLSDLSYQTEFVDLFANPTGYEAPTSETSASLYSESGSCEPPLLFSGYLITYNVTLLGALISDGGTMLPGQSGAGTIEPSLIQNLSGTYVSSINIANMDRTRVNSPAGCPPVEWPYATGGIYVNARCLRGHIRFQAGYNAVIQQGINSIDIGASVGSGMGQPCNEIPLFQTETPPTGSDLLEGGSECNQVIRSINGIGGTYGQFLAGNGVTITPLPDQNTLIIDVNMNQLQTCYSEPLISEVSEAL